MPTIVFGYGIQNEPCGERQATQEHERCRQNSGGEAGNQAGPCILRDNRDAQYEADKREHQRYEAEELERPVVLEERRDGHDDLDTVGYRVELGAGARRPVAVLDRHVQDAPAAIHRVDGELRLDLESFGEHGERLHERAREGAVTGHDIVEAVAVDPLDHEAHQVVAEPVERALVLLRVGAVREAVAHGHVGAALKDGVAEGPAGLGGIGVVAVHHEVAVSLDVAEHLAHHVALALPRFEAHHGAVFLRDLASAVGGVVVIDVYRGLRQRRAEVIHHLGDGDLLVVAGDKDGDLIGHERAPLLPNVPQKTTSIIVGRSNLW